VEVSVEVRIDDAVSVDVAMYIFVGVCVGVKVTVGLIGIVGVDRMNVAFGVPVIGIVECVEISVIAGELSSSDGLASIGRETRKISNRIMDAIRANLKEAWNFLCIDIFYITDEFIVNGIWF
jgi:hypothetical protein